jgi:hypothetical protein
MDRIERSHAEGDEAGNKQTDAGKVGGNADGDRHSPGQGEPAHAKTEASAGSWDADAALMGAFGMDNAGPTQSTGLRVDRKADGNETLASLDAQATVDGARSASAGKGLDGEVRGPMENAFGADFGDVRIHDGAAAGKAAGDLNARAFTTGNDIFFGSGQFDPGSEDGEHLLGHELAHVVQQGSGAKGTGNGPTISSAGDASEHEADRAADAVVRGESVGALGSGPTSAIHRDALGDLNSISKGNWIGDVSEGGALRKLESLTRPDKEKLASDASYHSMIDRLCDAFNKGEMLRMFRAIPQFDLRWRIYWLGRAGVRDELDAKQWVEIIGFASAAEMDALRAYPDGYRAFLSNAPARLIPPWDLLEGVEQGTRKGSSADIRNAVEGLNPAQKAKVIADEAKMAAVMSHAGNATERFRTLMYLNPPLKWKAYWLSVSGTIAHLTSAQWSEMLAQASQTEYDELVAYTTMWPKVEKYCPPSILQITRQNAKTDNAVAAMSDPVQINAMFASLGPAGFLAEATKGTALEITANFKAIQGQGKVLPTVNGLDRGAKMGVQSKANLRQWFFLETDPAVLEQMVAVRFAVATTGKGSMDHESGDDPAVLAPWTFDSLRQCWVVLEALPPQQVEQNPRFRHLLRQSNKGNGEAYFWGNDVVMGVKATDNITGGTAPADQLVFQAGGQGPGSGAVAVNQFNATLRHEVGHAVDNQLGIMDQMKGQENCGGWIKYGSYDSFVDAIIAAYGGLSGHGYADEGMVKKAMRQAVKKKKGFLDAYGDVSGDGRPARGYNKGPAAVLWTTDLWSGQPWYDDSWVTAPNNRNFQRAYGDDGSLYSFRADIMKSRRVTEYQWRAPGEWFAECYQVYYAEQETGRDVPVGGILRSKDTAAATLLANVADRGYSPQDMRGGTTNKAPGT